MLRLDGTTLRAVEASDLESTRRWRNDGRVNGPALGRRFPVTEVGERAWFEGLSVGAFPTQVVWAVADDTGAIVGLVQLNTIHWINRTAEFGVWIGPEHWGRGHGARATTLACDHGFTSLGLRQIRLQVITSNAAAITVYERVGFTRECTMRDAVLLDGEPCDLLQMMLDRASFNSPARQPDESS